MKSFWVEKKTQNILNYVLRCSAVLNMDDEFSVLGYYVKYVTTIHVISNEQARILKSLKICAVWTLWAKFGSGLSYSVLHRR